MDYVDDPQEIETNLRALEKIKEWAADQQVKMRKPMGAEKSGLGDLPPGDDMPSEDGEGSDKMAELADAMADDGGGEGAGDKDRELTVLSLSRPGDRAPRGGPPMEDKPDPFKEDPLKKFERKMPVGRRR